MKNCKKFILGNMFLLGAFIPFVEIITNPMLYTGFSTIALSLIIILLVMIMLVSCATVYVGWYEMIKKQ